MKRFKISAALGAIAMLLPVAANVLMSASASAQTNAADQAYLNDLHGFLRSQDNITYTMATQAMSAEQNVWAAQMFCQTFESGVDPAEAYTAYTSAALNQASSYGEAFTEEMAYAVGLYGGSVMNIGAAHYCPQHQAQVEQSLSSL